MNNERETLFKLHSLVKKQREGIATTFSPLNPNNVNAEENKNSLPNYGDISKLISGLGNVKGTTSKP